MCGSSARTAERHNPARRGENKFWATSRQCDCAFQPMNQCDLDRKHGATKIKHLFINLQIPRHTLPNAKKRETPVHPEQNPQSEKSPVVVLESGLGNYLACLQKVANDCRDGLIVTNADGQMLLFSDVAASLLGYEPAEILGQNVSVLMPIPFHARHDHYIATYRQTGKGKILGVGPRELPARRKDGSIVPIELSVSEIFWSGWPLFVALCRDISERKERECALEDAHGKLAASFECLQTANRELEDRQRELADINENLKAARDEARAANRVKSEFLATISHELRTPLNGIVGMTEVLAHTRLDDDQCRHLDVISQASETLLVLLNDLLDLAKAEAGRIVLELRPCALAPFARQIADHWGSLCKSKGIGFDMVTAKTLPEFVLFDPVRVRQVLDNLLGNALKFTESGQISFVVSYEDSGLQPVLGFDVIDTGIGIPMACREKIFESFTQADSSITRRFGGTGLGLAICKKLVTQMGGQIRLESTVGSGTAFSVRLPLHSVENTARLAEAASVKPRRELRALDRRMNVLVAEDNPSNQKVIAAALELLQCDFTIANNGVEAIRLLERGKFDLVLMDAHMPEMDGLEATRAIRARNDALSAIPIVGLTASTIEQDRESCLGTGMSGFVAKPFNLSELGAVLTRFQRAT